MNVTNPSPADTCNADQIAAVTAPNAPNVFTRGKDKKGNPIIKQGPAWHNYRPLPFWAECESPAYYRGLLHNSLLMCLGKDIKDICPHDFADPNGNHCAHFVAHMLGYTGHKNCRNSDHQHAWARRKYKGLAALIDVNSIFNQSPNRAEFTTSLPLGFTQGLIFACNKQFIDARNPKNPKMTAGRWKHIGIWYNNHVWHYGNTLDQVTQDTLAAFIKKFKAEYAKHGDVVFWHGDFLK